MNKRRFVSLGHIVNDIQPANHLGGSVSYTAVAAVRLGYEAHIITKCPKNHPYITLLENLGVQMHVLPSLNSTITTFNNIYDKQGERKQQSLQQQETITIEDFPLFPKKLLASAIIVVAPVIGEVDMALLPFLSKYGSIVVLPQGYFRTIQKDGTITPQEWNFDHKTVAKAEFVILSDKDIPEDETLNTSFLERLKSLVNICVLTHGEKGSTIYTNTGETNVTAFPLKENEIQDFTGAGDTYAATFITRYKQTKNIKEAALVASFYASLKIIGFRGIGIDSIPTKTEIQQFISQNANRIRTYLKENDTSVVSLF